MIFQPFIEKDLGHISYVIADNNEAIIIDPRRDIDEYIRFLTKNNLNLKYIINTHTHADYIGGHLELIDIYPYAKNIFQKDVPAKFDFIKVKEKDIFNIGNLKFKILETPGHTPFCISILVEENNIDKYIFTGDSLFVGDIGRPDLLGDEKLDELLELSYKSANKLWNLKDDIIVFTSHMEGSLCGKNLSNSYFSTIGIEKQTNNIFRLSQNKRLYIKNLLNQKIETPNYFKKMAFINIKGPKLLKTLSIQYVSDLNNIKENTYLVDLRHPDVFKNGFIANSINIYEKSNIYLLVGSLLDINSNICLIIDENINIENNIKKFRNIGFDNTILIFNIKNHSNKLKKVKKFKCNKIKEINLELYTINEILNYPFKKDICYLFKCKNGYKSSVIKSYFKNYMMI